MFRKEIKNGWENLKKDNSSAETNNQEINGHVEIFNPITQATMLTRKHGRTENLFTTSGVTTCWVLNNWDNLFIFLI